MCGRTACTLAPNDVVKACTYRDSKGREITPQWKDAPSDRQYQPSYNMAPGAHTPVILSGRHFANTELGSCSDSERVIMPMKWGLTPSWHQGDPYKVPYETNNCRMEGMMEKKTYKVPLHRGFRCVVLANGYFEWKTTKDGKQPYYFHFPMEQSKALLKQDLKTELKESFEDENNSRSADGVSNSHVLPDREPEGQKNTFCRVGPEIYDSKSFQALKSSNSSVAHVKLEKTSARDVKREMESFQDVPKEAFLVHDPNSHCKEFQDAQYQRQKFDDVGADINAMHSDCCLITMAGVFDIWLPSHNSTPLYSYSIITVPSARDISWCHHRMPAMLSSDEEIQNWLDFSNVPLQKASSMIKSREGLVFHPVTKLMNNSRYQGEDCLKPVDISKPKASPSSNLMRNWLMSASPAKKKKV